MLFDEATEPISIWHPKIVLEHEAEGIERESILIASIHLIADAIKDKNASEPKPSND